MVNKRISTLSSNKKVFDEAKPVYQEALDKAGHKHRLEYIDNIQLTKKNRCRTKAKYWYNPPYNMSLKTNLGREFFKLVDKNFTESNSLSKIFNRKSIKISYSTMKNMQQILTQTNSKKLNQGMKKDKVKQCRCENDIVCPLGGNCAIDNIVYKATVELLDPNFATENNKY